MLFGSLGQAGFQPPPISSHRPPGCVAKHHQPTRTLRYWCQQRLRYLPPRGSIHPPEGGCRCRRCAQHRRAACHAAPCVWQRTSGVWQDDKLGTCPPHTSHHSQKRLKLPETNDAASSIQVPKDAAKLQVELVYPRGCTLTAHPPAMALLTSGKLAHPQQAAIGVPTPMCPAWNKYVATMHRGGVCASNWGSCCSAG